MAYIFPNTPPMSIPPEVLKVYRFLKTLPDDYVIWHHLAPWQKDAPDFLILTESRKVLLVKVSGASQATPAAQLVLIQDDQLPLGQEEKGVIRKFLQPLNGDGNSIASLILYPNLADAKVQESRLIKETGDPHWAGREWVQAGAETRWPTFFDGPALDPINLERIRQWFTPEVIVPSTMTVRPPIQRRLEAGLTDYLLDYNQEAAVKWDLDLPQDGQSTSRDLHLNIVNGVAGSGKTLILLYRLRLLYSFFPDKRFLVLTHNRPLIRDMQSRFVRLTGKEPENIEWATFSSWCFQHWPKHVPKPDPLSKSRREALINEIWRQHFMNTKITEKMLLSEIDWFKDQLPLDRSAYLTVERTGRGFRLGQAERERMFDAITAYEKLLHERGQLDWSDVPRRMWTFIQDGLISLPQYDVILIDEAQFFAPLWFDLLKGMVKPGTGHLFVVADPTQGFLRRGGSWRSLGLEARGRSQQLRKSYRSTQEILNFATLFYRLRVPNEIDQDILAPDLMNMPNGVLPALIPLASRQDENARVVNEIEALIKQGMQKRQLLVLHANWHGVETLTQMLNRRLGPNSTMDPKDTFPGNYIRVTTLNAGTGLESPIVFLAGMHELFEEEQSLRLSDEEREAVMLDNTRKIYMAATRAGQRLVFTYVGDLPEVLRKCFQF